MPLSGRYHHLQLGARGGAAKKCAKALSTLKYAVKSRNVGAAAERNPPAFRRRQPSVTVSQSPRLRTSPALPRVWALTRMRPLRRVFTVHQSFGEICCHHCGNQYAIPKAMPQMRQHYADGPRYGHIEQLAEALQQEFPNIQ